MICKVRAISSSLDAAALPFGPVTTAEACSTRTALDDNKASVGLLEGANATALPQETKRASVESANFMAIAAICLSYDTVYPNVFCVMIMLT
jgi:hypothetical protein